MLIQKTDIFCRYVLGKDPERVLHIASSPKDYYDQFNRAKKDKNGNKRKNKPQYIERFGVFWMRTINPPKEELKQIQKSINKYLVDNISMPLYAYGGVKGRDNILNARVHKGKKYVFQTDLRDFFPFVTNQMVYGMLVTKGFSPDVASLITKLTTVNGHLPQGAPTSTTVANLVFEPVGDRIMALSEEYGLLFTTFVDDVTISSQTDFKDLVPIVVEMIQSAGFKISQGKTSYKSGITTVTGVKMKNNALAVPDKILSAISSEQGVQTNRARGLLNYAKRIKDVSARKRTILGNK